MNILFVSSGNKKQGISPIIKKQGESISKKNHNIEYFTIRGKGIKGYLKSVLPLFKILKSKKHDVLHAHYGLNAIVCHLSQIFRIKKTPLIISLMGSDLLIPKSENTFLQKWINLYINWILKNKANHIIVKTSELNKKVNLPIKTSIIPNGVDFNLFKPLNKSELQNELKWSNDCKHILFAANPERPVKNYNLAKNAADQIKEYRVELHDLVDIDHEKIPKYMNASDVVILSSFFEGSPNVIKEAMACNRPIVCTNVGDVKLIIENIEGCFLAEAETSDFRKKMIEALRFDRSTEGRENIRHLSEDKVAEKIICIYEKMTPNF
jgi:glycosyltransferase involved in cell wall biosynthesis